MFLFTFFLEPRNIFHHFPLLKHNNHCTLPYGYRPISFNQQYPFKLIDHANIHNLKDIVALLDAEKHSAKLEYNAAHFVLLLGHLITLLHGSLCSGARGRVVQSLIAIFIQPLAASIEQKTQIWNGWNGTNLDHLNGDNVSFSRKQSSPSETITLPDRFYIYGTSSMLLLGINISSKLSDFPRLNYMSLLKKHWNIENDGLPKISYCFSMIPTQPLQFGFNHWTQISDTICLKPNSLDHSWLDIKQTYCKEI